MRALLLACALLLAAGPAAATAQEPPALTPTPEPYVLPEEDAAAPERDPCEGADADYQYAYCDAVPAAGGDEEGGGPGRPDEPQPQALPADTLPLTGSETRFLVVAGLGLLFAGAGLRLSLPGAGRGGA